MSEWDCKHGVSDDAQTPCPLCSRDRRIAELTEESAQWQESCGQNFVRAEQAEDRVNWFEQENDTLRKRNSLLRIAELEEYKEKYPPEYIDDLQHKVDVLQIEVDTLRPPFEEWVREAGLGICRSENEKLKARIAKLEAALKDLRNDRIAELEDECGKLRSLLRDDRDCWARNDELEARNAKLEAALRRIRDEGRKDTTWFARFIVDESGKALEQSK